MFTISYTDLTAETYTFFAPAEQGCPHALAVATPHPTDGHPNWEEPLKYFASATEAAAWLLANNEDAQEGLLTAEDANRLRQALEALCL